MQLLLAFLIAFGVVTAGSRQASTLTEKQAQELVKKNNLTQQFVIYGAEGDDF
jgi:hypothetical protein